MGASLGLMEWDKPLEKKVSSWHSKGGKQISDE